jgi:hypothetical protein
MRILLTKISDRRHALEVVRGDDSRERVELVTREFLFHDLLHYAVESALGTQGGFWGALANGKTLADLNDRSGVAMKDYSGTMYAIEQAVGMMTGAIKSGGPAERVLATFRGYFEALGQTTPEWCTAGFIADVCERMRRIQGHWKATPYRQTMELAWPVG